MNRKFLSDRKGNFAITTAILIIPIMAGVGLGIDYANIVHEKNTTLQALDAACVATGRRITEGATDDEARTYAANFFEANLNTVDPAMTTLSLVMPDTEEGGGLLKCKAALKYKPILMSAADTFGGTAVLNVDLDAQTNVRLKNTTEIALVLDNSGSMSNTGTGTSSKRIDLLKGAAKYLVQQLTNEAKKVKQVVKPIQFAVVPFSASVNVGPNSDTESWMDTQGRSPVHHENFDWSQMTPAASPTKYVEKVGDIYYKRGPGWNKFDENGIEEVLNGTPLTRFTLYQDMVAQTGHEWVASSDGSQQICVRKKKGVCTQYQTGDYHDTFAQYSTWQGCVEARPYPYNVNDAAPDSQHPETLYVPMFAPDEPGNFWRDIDGDGYADRDSADWGYPNNYWVDSNDSLGYKGRARDGRKYFMTKPWNASNPGSGKGPNFSCTTTTITPLKDVTVQAEKDKIDAAINSMSPTGMTNVPEGLAWGWRTLSHGAPFTGGRSETEKGNDKVIIVLTDGANTYSDLDDGSYAALQSTYAAYGYTGVGYDGGSTTRMFLGTDSDVGKTNYSGSNYTKALDQQMEKVCENAKNEKITIFTVALDLDYDEGANSGNDKNAAIKLKDCASSSKYRKDSNGNFKKLFYNAKGSELTDVFKAIAEELSNLRIVG